MLCKRESHLGSFPDYAGTCLHGWVDREIVQGVTGHNDKQRPTIVGLGLKGFTFTPRFSRSCEASTKYSGPFQDIAGKQAQPQ